MPKAKDKTKRRRIEELEEDSPPSQSRRRGASQLVDDDEIEEVDCTQTGKSQSQKTQNYKELSKEELKRKTSDVARYLLFTDRKKYPVKRGDITKNVLKEHAKSFNEIFDHAKKNLNKVFAIEVEEIDVGKSRGYILVDGVKSEEQHELIDWGDDLPKMGLLMVVLGMIFMCDHVITESKLWHMLKKLGIEPKKEHEVFGDSEKLISQEFVRQCYLDRKKVLGGDEAAYEYRWGARAEKELTWRQALKFVSEIYGTQMEDWTAQMKEITAKEESDTKG
ncbi:non-structural maintenance of chromosomes element 3 homolog [Pocillopora verrucosa]|uniref:non-structural maintenance of chromosomes element 3 homolog n=1 Tax=Pocillopora verrucosa TaxID=203993 RepID=UPI00333ECD02